MQLLIQILTALTTMILLSALFYVASNIIISKNRSPKNKWLFNNFQTTRLSFGVFWFTSCILVISSNNPTLGVITMVLPIINTFLPEVLNLILPMKTVITQNKEKPLTKQDIQTILDTRYQQRLNYYHKTAIGLTITGVIICIGITILYLQNNSITDLITQLSNISE